MISETISCSIVSTSWSELTILLMRCSSATWVLVVSTGLTTILSFPLLNRSVGRQYRGGPIHFLNRRYRTIHSHQLPGLQGFHALFMLARTLTERAADGIGDPSGPA